VNVVAKAKSEGILVAMKGEATVVASGRQRKDAETAVKQQQRCAVLHTRF